MFFSILSALIYLLAFVRYIYATFKSGTRPNRATWFIWLVLGFVLLVSSYATGARETLPLLIVNQLGFVAIFFISLRSGEGGWTNFDKFCLIGAAMALLCWFFSGSAIYALLIGILIDLFGALPTFKKAYLDPKHEDTITWILFLLGNSVNLLAIPSWTLELSIYPVYMVSVCVVTLLMILFSPNSRLNKNSR
ncbi:hypothetical protein HY990_07015 [Candidatus Micrarchaeota archaeon]|nr:hypothetical protein [Candidatus Micrarchaeota archaeon]